MKKYFLMLIVTLSLAPALAYADKRQNEIKEVQKLSAFDNKCAQFDKKACQTLQSKLAKMCTSANNSFACFRLGEIATINSEIAARQGLRKDSVSWLGVAVDSTKRACQLNLPQACTQMKKFKVSFQQSCKEGDQFFCKALKLL